MSFEVPGVGAPDELRCRYGSSKLMFRGPRRHLDDPYIAFLGGSETFGQHVQTPFVSMVDDDLGKPCINLGVVSAGLDAFVNDPDVLTIAGHAEQAVVQILGAQNLSNRFYRVHPRRNDRFVAPSALLSAIFREVDFTDFHFIRHMLGTLQAISPERFATVRDELQQAWLSRMHLMVRAIRNDIVLLWLQYDQDDMTDLGPDPLFVTDDMIDQLRPLVQQVVKVSVVPARSTGEVGDMVFGQLQAPAAGHLIGPAMHRQVADTLKRRLAK